MKSLIFFAFLLCASKTFAQNVITYTPPPYTTPTVEEKKFMDSFNLADSISQVKVGKEIAYLKKVRKSIDKEILAVQILNLTGKLSKEIVMTNSDFKIIADFHRKNKVGLLNEDLVDEFIYDISPMRRHLSKMAHMLYSNDISPIVIQRMPNSGN